MVDYMGEYLGVTREFRLQAHMRSPQKGTPKYRNARNLKGKEFHEQRFKLLYWQHHIES